MFNLYLHQKPIDILIGW